jgi:hypothetical protein
MIEAWHGHTSSYSPSICHSICHHYHARIARSHRWISRFINFLFSFNTPPQVYRTAVNLNNYLVCWAAGRVGWLGWLTELTDRLAVLAGATSFSSRTRIAAFEQDAKPLSLICTKGLFAAAPPSFDGPHAPPQRDVSIAALNWDAKLLNRWPDQTGLRPTSVSPPQRDASVAALKQKC